MNDFNYDELSPLKLVGGYKPTSSYGREYNAREFPNSRNIQRPKLHQGLKGKIVAAAAALAIITSGANAVINKVNASERNNDNIELVDKTPIFYKNVPYDVIGENGLKVVVYQDGYAIVIDGNSIKTEVNNVKAGEIAVRCGFNYEEIYTFIEKAKNNPITIELPTNYLQNDAISEEQISNSEVVWFSDVPSQFANRGGVRVEVLADGSAYIVDSSGRSDNLNGMSSKDVAIDLGCNPNLIKSGRSL